VTVTDYEHDALGRLTESVTGDYTATYGWDAASNLVAESVSDDVDTSLADDGWVIDRAVNQVNQVTSVVTDGRLPEVHTTTESLTHDARGNRTGSITTRTTGGTTHDLSRVDYTFDGMNQLVGVHDFGDNLNNPKDDQVTAWVRDGLGRALTVTEKGTARSRVFDGTAMITEGDTRVTFGPDGRVLSEAFETVVGHGKRPPR
jgi:YD repeat-containing protein